MLNSEFLLELVARRKLTKKQVRQLNKIKGQPDWKDRVLLLLLTGYIKEGNDMIEYLGYGKAK